MASTYTIRPGLKLQSVEPPYAKFSYYGSVHVIQGEKFELLSDFLEFLRNGGRTRNELQRRFGNATDPLLSKLQSLRFCDEFPTGQAEPPPERASSYLQGFYQNSIYARKLESALTGKQIGVYNLTATQLPVEAAFSDVGLRVVDLTTSEKTSTAFDVILGCWHSPHSIVDLSVKLTALHRPHLLVMLESFGGSVGPILGDVGGPCFRCLARRRDSNSQNLASQNSFNHALATSGVRADFEVNSLFTQLLLSMTAAKVYNQLAEIESVSANRELRSFDFREWTSDRSQILSVPGCETCAPSS